MLRYGLTILLVLILAMPGLARAQVEMPPLPPTQNPPADWSKEFMAGMTALASQDMEVALEAFKEGAKKGDRNSEFYLALLYAQKGDRRHYREWMSKAALHGHELAMTILELEERFK